MQFKFKIEKLFYEKLLNILLYGSEDFSFNKDKKIMKSAAKILKTSESFIDPLFWPYIYSKDIEWPNIFFKVICICMCSTWMQAHSDLLQVCVQCRVGFILLLHYTCMISLVYLPRCLYVKCKFNSTVRKLKFCNI